MRKTKNILFAIWSASFSSLLFVIFLEKKFASMKKDDEMLTNLVDVNKKQPIYIDETKKTVRGAVGSSILSEEHLSVLSKRYKRYKYTAPSYRKETDNESSSICGEGPVFKEYFQQDQYNRSANNEDQIIFNFFFNHSNPPSKGSYIELGAFNGIQEANTRFFDICLGWEGLLIEGNPTTFGNLLTNRPNTHRMNFAPSCLRKGERAKFSAPASPNSGELKYRVGARVQRKNIVPCGPLGPVIEDIFAGGGHVNFFSLDVEGAELEVLNTIDFKKVQIDVMMIEIENRLCKARKFCEKRDKVRKKMQAEGYTMYKEVIMKSDIYVHPKSPYLMKKN